MIGFLIFLGSAIGVILFGALARKYLRYTPPAAAVVAPIPAAAAAPVLPPPPVVVTTWRNGRIVRTLLYPYRRFSRLTLSKKIWLGIAVAVGLFCVIAAVGYIASLLSTTTPPTAAPVVTAPPPGVTPPPPAVAPPPSIAPAPVIPAAPRWYEEIEWASLEVIVGVMLIGMTLLILGWFLYRFTKLTIVTVFACLILLSLYGPKNFNDMRISIQEECRARPRECGPTVYARSIPTLITGIISDTIAGIRGLFPASTPALPLTAIVVPSTNEKEIIAPVGRWSSPELADPNLCYSWRGIAFKVQSRLGSGPMLDHPNGTARDFTAIQFQSTSRAEEKVYFSSKPRVGGRC